MLTVCLLLVPEVYMMKSVMKTEINETGAGLASVVLFAAATGTFQHNIGISLRVLISEQRGSTGQRPISVDFDSNVHTNTVHDLTI